MCISTPIATSALQKCGYIQADLQPAYPRRLQPDLQCPELRQPGPSTRISTPIAAHPGMGPTHGRAPSTRISTPIATLLLFRFRRHIVPSTRISTSIATLTHHLLEQSRHPSTRISTSIATQAGDVIKAHKAPSTRISTSIATANNSNKSGSYTDYYVYINLPECLSAPTGWSLTTASRFRDVKSPLKLREPFQSSVSASGSRFFFFSSFAMILSIPRMDRF